MTRLRLAERRTLVRLAVAGVLLISAGAALGWKAGQTDEPPALPTAKEKWALAAPQGDDTTKDLAILNLRKPWGSPDEARREQPTARTAPPQWRLAGIVVSGEEKLALISTGQYPRARFEYRRIGESLPDGSILVQITSDSAKTESRSAPGPASSPAFPPSPRSPSSPPASSSPQTHTYRLFEKK